ncbi:hypothetical protein [Pseudomonas petrae]|uniref:hypothetical protein n=1 Tax=Pseudomonas petrae TaxID=2912190 RepID=UPI001F1816D0|nr:hypothetical protein [Pseudomonas petrae]MCF7539385.1 hypothetical protein [Pseudomonas petrae]
MSHLSLASLLNELARAQRALISEGEFSLSVSSLRAPATLRVIDTASTAGWDFSIHDMQGNEYYREEILDDCAPFRVELEKPRHLTVKGGTVLFLVTEVGFSTYLQKGHPAIQWRLLGLTKPFCSRLRSYSSWHETLECTDVPPTKPPRLLVKESASVSSVPEDTRHWLLADGQSLDYADPLNVIWAMHSFDALCRCVANEIDGTGSTLTFKGPPKLNLKLDTDLQLSASCVALQEFLSLQEAAAWVYENAREAEVKHILLSAEIARSGRANGHVIVYFKEHLASALECAKIAYQMSVSEVTKDMLKALADLRKAVTEETSKATDVTRQSVAAIATSLTIGIGLIAARVNVQVNAYLVSAVMLVAVAYTGISVFSGWTFISIQKKLREEWQPKLYRYLSTEEFSKMVAAPISQAENVFFNVAKFGFSALALVALGVVLIVFLHTNQPSATLIPSAAVICENPTRPDISLPQSLSRPIQSNHQQ